MKIVPAPFFQRTVVTKTMQTVMNEWALANKQNGWYHDTAWHGDPSAAMLLRLNEGVVAPLVSSARPASGYCMSPAGFTVNHGDLGWNAVNVPVFLSQSHT